MITKLSQDDINMKQTTLFSTGTKSPTSGAYFSPDRIYRYVLWRIWDKSKPAIMFIGLNPSTADESLNDPTITRCLGFSKSWGYGSLYMLNLFAFRATDPNDMKSTSMPIGEENLKYLIQYAKTVDQIICAWGNHGSYLNQSKIILDLFRKDESLFTKLYYFKLSQKGEPVHPLYQSADSKLTKYN